MSYGFSSLERLKSFLGNRSVPKPFRTNALDKLSECPACSRIDTVDVYTGLCQPCHGALRLLKAHGSHL